MLTKSTHYFFGHNANFNILWRGVKITGNALVVPRRTLQKTPTTSRHLPIASLAISFLGLPRLISISITEPLLKNLSDPSIVYYMKKNYIDYQIHNV